MSKRKQPQRLPPPITHGAAPIDAGVILTEFPGELAVVLWKTVRSVRMWSDLPESHRPKAFGAGTREKRLEAIEGVDVAVEVRAALARASSVLQPRARTAAVATACSELSEWSAAAGQCGTAIEFMQAAALAVPEDAALAHRVGRLARTAGEYHRAETWYRQAISRARRSRSWDEFARSYIGLGTVFTLRGSYPQASKSLIRGLRAARRFSIRPLVAAAAHELVVVGIRTNRTSEISRFGRIAVSAYGVQHPRLPALSHDLGIYLLNAGYFDAAFRIIQATPADFGAPVDQLVRWSALVRVAGALGKKEMYAEALARSETLLNDATTRPAATEARLAMAVGADLMGDRERALEEAGVVRDLAAQQGEAQLGFAAESLIESIRNGEIAHARAGGHSAATNTPRPLAGLVKELESAMGTVRPG